MDMKILLIDDEPEILENLETILSDEGYEVVKASSGNEGIAKFETGAFGLVISDMKMPGLSGLDVLQRVKQIDKDVEVIILTGYGSMENAIQVLRNDGAYDYLAKPLEDIEKLLITVENAMERRRVNSENKRLVRELKESEEKFRTIFDQSFQFFGLMTIDGTLIEVNRTALEFAGIEAQVVLGKPFWETTLYTHSPESQERVKEDIRKAANGELVRFETFHPATDGSMHYFDTSFKPVKDEAGNVYLLLVEGRDITERKLAFEKIKVLSGIVPICMFCKKIRNDKGYWDQLEKFIENHSDAQFSHGVCDACLKEHFPEYADDLEEERTKPSCDGAVKQN